MITKCLVISVCVLVAGACRDSTHEVVVSALLAQTRGLGGCTAVDTLRPRTLADFPDVTFFDGDCSGEHGNPIRAIAAVDRTGQVYLLDNPSSFGFLVQRHTPKPIQRDHALEYLASALAMMGVIDPLDLVVAETSSLPDSVLRAAGIQRQQLMDSSRVLKDIPKGYEIAMTTLGNGSLTAIIAVVYADSGFVQVMSKRSWKT